MVIALCEHCNSPDNYRTACRECNQGKGDILLIKEEQEPYLPS